jgi:hypothetical protein
VYTHPKARPFSATNSQKSSNSDLICRIYYSNKHARAHTHSTHSTHTRAHTNTNISLHTLSLSRTHTSIYLSIYLYTYVYTYIRTLININILWGTDFPEFVSQIQTQAVPATMCGEILPPSLEPLSLEPLSLE